MCQDSWSNYLVLAPCRRCVSGHCAWNLGRIATGITVLVTACSIVWCRLAFLVENLPCFIRTNIFHGFCLLLRRNSKLANNYFFQRNFNKGNSPKQLCCFCLEWSCVLVRNQKPLPSNWLLMALLFQSPAWSWFLFSVGSWSSVEAKKEKSLSSRREISCLLAAGAVPYRGSCEQAAPWCCNLAQFPARERKIVCGFIWWILKFQTEQKNSCTCHVQYRRLSAHHARISRCSWYLERFSSSFSFLHAQQQHSNNLLLAQKEHA